MLDDRLAQAPLAIVPAEEAGAPSTPDAIFLDAHERDWSLWAACPACGGYSLPLHIRHRDHWEQAAARAQTFLDLVHHKTCLRCDALRRRGSDGAPDEGLWFDPDRGDWMVDGEMSDGTPVRLPLDVKDYWAVPEAAAAAAAIATDGPPVRAVPGFEGVDTEVPSVFWESGRWRLWLPCDECGGLELGLDHDDRLAAAEAAGQAKRMVELAAAEGCPACTAALFREAPLPPDCPPMAWYDTDTDEWMLWQPVDDIPGGVTLPLGVRGFDASRIAIELRIEQLLFED